MIAQNLPIVTLQSQLATDDQSPQCHLELLYRNLVNKTQQIPLLKKMISLEAKTTATAQSIGTGKLISKKMRLKLISWLQKLSIETFEFSTETLLLTIKVLDEYLCLTNEAPSQLQLIGCAALFLAAKNSEPVIIAGQCYVTASANCFTQQQLNEKELQIFKSLNFNTTFCSLSKQNFLLIFRVYNILKINQLAPKLSSNQKNDVDNLLVDIVKNLDFLQWKSHKIVSMIIAMTEVKKELPKLNELQEKLQFHCGC